MESVEEIKIKADYCLNCKLKPCQNACPMNTNIPEFIQYIKKNDIRAAYNVLINNNIFSPICSAICPQEFQCESKCSRGIKSKPVSIGKLEYWVNEYARKNSFQYKLNKKNDNWHKVAIIGSGPASLSCAYELVREGFDVTIFEKEDKLGGILRYGIPEFRLNKEQLDNIIKQILDIGVKVKNRCELGKNISIKELREQGYEFIFIGIGAGKARTYSVSDDKLNNIFTSDFFLKQYNSKNKIKELGKTIVVGGGNVAMDCARSALRMGASEVSILYRRSFESMPARKIEIKEAVDEGIKILPNTKVISAEGLNERITKIDCIKTIKSGEQIKDLEGSNYSMQADSLIFAIGLLPELNILEKEGLKMKNGLLETDDEGRTNLLGVYAAGDVKEGKSTVCKALAAGRKVAQNIIKKVENMQ